MITESLPSALSSSTSTSLESSWEVSRTSAGSTSVASSSSACTTSSNDAPISSGSTDAIPVVSVRNNQEALTQEVRLYNQASQDFEQWKALAKEIQEHPSLKRYWQEHMFPTIQLWASYYLWTDLVTDGSSVYPVERLSFKIFWTATAQGSNKNNQSPAESAVRCFQRKLANLSFQTLPSIVDTHTMVSPAGSSIGFEASPAFDQENLACSVAEHSTPLIFSDPTLQGPSRICYSISPESPAFRQDATALEPLLKALDRSALEAIVGRFENIPVLKKVMPSPIKVDASPDDLTDGLLPDLGSRGLVRLHTLHNHPSVNVIDALELCVENFLKSLQTAPSCVQDPVLSTPSLA